MREDTRENSGNCGRSIWLLISLVSVSILLALTGCGYTFEGGGSILPSDVRRVYIPVVANNTPESSLTTALTEALRDRFERYGVLSVVAKESQADATLEAEVVEIKRDTRTSTGVSDFALQNSVTVVVAAELKRRSGQLLWRNKRLSASRTYGAASNVVVTTSPNFSSSSLNAGDLGGLSDREISRGQETEVFNEIAEQAARQIYEQAVLPEF